MNPNSSLQNHTMPESQSYVVATVYRSLCIGSLHPQLQTNYKRWYFPALERNIVVDGSVWITQYKNAEKS